jgi:hypothetical protein
LTIVLFFNQRLNIDGCFIDLSTFDQQKKRFEKSFKELSEHLSIILLLWKHVENIK